MSANFFITTGAIPSSRATPSSGFAVLDAEARPVQRGLGIQPVICQGGHHLQMPLRLHKTAHHSEAGMQFFRWGRAWLDFSGMGCQAGIIVW